jgi:suppressor of ftsI
VTFASTGELVFKTRQYDQGGDMYPETPLAHVAVSGAPGAPIEPLGADAAVAQPSDLLDRPVVAHRTWTFTEDDATSNFFINGQEFDHNRVDVSPKLGTVEEWTLSNQTMEQHPFHIHVNDFKVLSIDGRPYAAKGEQDTVVLDPMSSVVIRAPFDDFTGKFVFHCHILNHEDNGMMALVDVVE